MMRGAFFIALLATSLLAAIPTPVSAAIDKACGAPDDIVSALAPLPHVAPALKPNGTLRILAIGSASMFGPEPGLAATPANGTPRTPAEAHLIEATPSDMAFPQQMAKVLRTDVPGLKVEIVTRGGRGLSAADQFRLLQENVGKEPFQLVLWQTGTVEAVRNLPPSEFAQTLAEGATLAQQANADLILIDPQFSRFLQTNSNIEPYEQAFQQLGSLPGVLVFHRFELMRSWVNEGRLDLERTPKGERKRAVEQLHACLGAQLAKIIINAARS